MSEPIRIRSEDILSIRPPGEIDVTDVWSSSPVREYIRGYQNPGEITIRFQPKALAAVGEEKPWTVRARKLKMRFRGQVVAYDPAAGMTLRATSALEQLRIRASRGWRRHIRREKALAKRRLTR